MLVFSAGTNFLSFAFLKKINTQNNFHSLSTEIAKASLVSLLNKILQLPVEFQTYFCAMYYYEMTTA